MEREARMASIAIAESTVLKISDVLINPFGELFRIISTCNKNCYVINEFEKPLEDDEKGSLIVTKDTLVSRIWRKLDYNALIKFIFA